MTEVELIEKAAIRVGITSLMNQGAASCVYSEGCNGVTQEHLIAFAREIAVHCVAALSPAAPESKEPSNEVSALMKFYGVGSEADLIAAQARHVEKLQAKMPPASAAIQRVREG